MTTQENKAYEYASQRYCELTQDRQDEFNHDEIERAYISGYTEATRWRDVNVELPPMSEKGIKNRHIKYIVKRKKDDAEEISLSEYTKYGWENCSCVIAWRFVETI